MLITPTTSVTTRMKLRVSTCPSKRLSPTMGYGVRRGGSEMRSPRLEYRRLSRREKNSSPKGGRLQ
jgi:hypothetical protein